MRVSPFAAPTNRSATESTPASQRRWAAIAAALGIAPLVLLTLRLVPALDLRFESAVGHFWIVTTAASIAVALALLILRVAVVRRDGRVLLIGSAFLALSAIFFVHAISTPGIVFSNTEHATRWSTPLALLAGAILLSLSSLERFACQPWLLRHWRWWISIGLVLWMGYATLMLVYVPHHSTVEAPTAAVYTPDDGYSSTDMAIQPQADLQTLLNTLAPQVFPYVTMLTMLLYLATALVYGRRWWRTPTRPLAAITCSGLLLANTALAAQLGLTWHLSFWLYHVLLLTAIGVATYGVVIGYERSGSLTSAVEGLMLGTTLQRQREAFQSGMGLLLETIDRGDVAALPRLRHDLQQRFALANDQLDLLEHAVGVLSRERQEQRRLQALLDVSRAATAELDADVLLNSVVQTLSNAMHPALTAIGLVEDQHLVFHPQHRLLNGHPATETIVVPLRALPEAWHHDDDTPFVDTASFTLAAIAAYAGAMLLVPLRHHQHLLGVLAFQPLQHTPIDQHLTTLHCSIGAHLAAALANARLYQQLQQEHLHLQNSENSRDDLTQMIVHDLKNPLTAIMSYLDLLNRAAATDSQRELIGGARRSSRNMLGLVTDLLDVSRLAEGRMELDLSPTRLRTLLHDAADEMYYWANQEQKSIQVQHLRHNLLLNVDIDLLRRVIINLLSNAIKHTPPRARIEIGSHVEDGDIHIWVRDNGTGIAPEQLATLFERYTTHGRGIATQRNTGLGLTFCKLAIEAHGGRIEVDSTPGKGATFSIVLPPSSIAEENYTLPVGDGAFDSGSR